jgi:hypothetical protein
VLLDERSAAATVKQAPPRAVPAVARPSGVVLLVAGSLALAALSLLLPSAPTYDPWAWIVWGREVAHLDLNTVDGPSWKPLPVAFTTIFSFFGSASPDLWLVVARAGAIAAVVLAFRVARRLGGGIAGGVAAAAALAIAPWWIRNVALGNSEGLMVAFVLGAVDRHLAGRPRAAFLLAACAGLLRPEAWPFLAAYGLWLMWRRALPARLVVGVGVGVLALWLLPEAWGSGDLLRAAHRAKDVNPGAPTYADNPALEVLRDAGAMLTGVMLAGLALAAGLLAVRRDRALAVLSVAAIAWLGLVAYMTQDGFSGNQRYLITPVALLIVLAGVGAGWAVTRVAGRLVRAPVAAVALAAAAVGAAFVVPSLGRLEPTLHSLEYQAKLVDELPDVVRAAGGADALRRCGTPYTGPFLVPAVAWNLRVHTSDVRLDTGTPAVVLRERTTSRSRPVPTLRGLDGVAGVRTAAVGENWRIVTACGGAQG